MAYGDFKDLPRRAASDKVLHDKAFNTAKHLKYDGHQRIFASMVYKFFDKKPSSLADKSAAKGIGTTKCNTYHRTITMKSVDAKDNTYIEFW